MTKQEQTKQIEVELAACRAAWAQFFADNKLKSTDIRFTDNTPIFAWCLHHNRLIESLKEPVENRIAYILHDKSKNEQVCRFLNLRPISLTSAWAEYNKVCDAAQAEFNKVRDPAWAEYCKVRDSAQAEYSKVRDPARAEYNKVCDAARAEYNKVCDAAHLVDVPNHTWNGTSIFKQ